MPSSICMLHPCHSICAAFFLALTWNTSNCLSSHATRFYQTHTRVRTLISVHTFLHVHAVPPPTSGWVGGWVGGCWGGRCVAQSLCILQCSKVADDNLNGMKCPLHLERFRDCCCKSAVDALVMGTPPPPPPPPTTIFLDIGIPHGIPVGHAAVGPS